MNQVGIVNAHPLFFPGQAHTIGPVDFHHQQARADHSVWPSWTSDDALGLRSWLATLGFAEGVLVEENGVVHHSEMYWPEGGRIMVSTANPDDEHAMPAGVGDVYVVTARPDEIHRLAVDTDYGSRDFSVRSPDGHRLSFGTYDGS